MLSSSHAHSPAAPARSPRRPRGSAEFGDLGLVVLATMAACAPRRAEIPPNDTAALRQDVDQFMANAMADESVPGAVVPGFAVVCEMARA